MEMITILRPISPRGQGVVAVKLASSARLLTLARMRWDLLDEHGLRGDLAETMVYIS